MWPREEEKPHVKNFEKEHSSFTVLTHRSHAIENLEREKEMKKHKKVPDHEFNIQLFTDRIDGEILSIQTHLCEQMQLVPAKPSKYHIGFYTFTYVECPFIFDLTLLKIIFIGSNKCLKKKLITKLGLQSLLKA